MTSSVDKEYEPDEVIVALPHERPVLDALDKAKGTSAGPVEVDRDDVLGLARIRFDAAATVEGLKEVEGWEAVRARLDARHRAPAAMDPLDQALRGLRGVLALQWSGWTPTMGKNRIVDTVEGGGRTSHGVSGAGRISHGGGTAPTAATRVPALPQGVRPGQGVRVGVLDTGLSPRSRLAGCYARYSDLLLPDEDASSRAGHATFVAGLVLSQAPGATVEVRRGLDGPDATGDSWSVARKIVEFGRDGVDVLNLSFLCFTRDDEPPLTLAAAVDRLDPAIVVVAAAGNHGGDEAHGGRPAWPAALDDVVAVGAVDAAGERAGFSPPEDLPWIDVRARGVDLVSTFLDGVTPEGGGGQYAGFAQWSGTSFAAALVSGAVAAATDPGRVPARAAWDDMRQALARAAEVQAASAQAERTKAQADGPPLSERRLQPVLQLHVP